MPKLNENYELPKNGWKYLKFKDGDTKFRVLSDVITGYEYFDNDNKVHRSEELFKETPWIKDSYWKPWYAKHFWAMTVWDYDDESIKILTFSQRAIQEALLWFIRDPDFGDIKSYDVKITRSGKDKETSYQVKALPAKPFENKKAIEEANSVNLEALYTNQDPFSTEFDSPF